MRPRHHAGDAWRCRLPSELRVTRGTSACVGLEQIPESCALNQRVDDLRAVALICRWSVRPASAERDRHHRTRS